MYIRKIKLALLLLIGFVLNSAVAQQKQPEQIRDILEKDLNKSPKELYEIAVSRLAPEAIAIFKYDPAINSMLARERLLTQALSDLREQLRSWEQQRQQLKSRFIIDKRKIEESSSDSASEIKSLIELYYPHLDKLKKNGITALAQADKVDAQLADLRKDLAMARRIRDVHTSGVNTSEVGLSSPNFLSITNPGNLKGNTIPSIEAKPTSARFPSVKAAIDAMETILSEQDTFQERQTN